MAAVATKRELIAAEDAAWMPFNELIESLSAPQIEEPGYNETWSVKDLMAHLACWQAEAVRMLEQIRMGTYTDDPVDVGQLNAQFYEWNKDLPLFAVKAEYWSARTMMLMEWNALPEVTRLAEEWFMESGPKHHEEHTPRLREWVETLLAR